jgi:hypothetical protein
MKTKYLQLELASKIFPRMNKKRLVLAINNPKTEFIKELTYKKKEIRKLKYYSCIEQQVTLEFNAQCFDNDY